MELHLKTAGVLLIALALVHATFPRYFDWKAELSRLSLINRQMMYGHTFFIALTVLLMGILCVTSSALLAGTPLGRRVAIGLAFFWAARLFVQFFGYSPKLWRRKRLETAAHIVAALFWTYLTVVFAWCASTAQCTLY